MRVCLLILLYLLASSARAGNLSEVLSMVDGVTADEENFISQVAWVDEPEKAYYSCSDRLNTPSLELWQGPENLVRSKSFEDQPLLYGELGPIVVLSYFKEERVPTLAAYLILPSGEMHLFRVTSDHSIARNSQRWQCERQEWRTP